MTPARVMLLELVASGRGRFTMEQSFPFVYGLLRRQAIPTTWLRFGLPAAVQLMRREEGMGLEEPDADVLIGRIRREAITHVLCNRPMAASLAARVEAEGVAIRTASGGDGDLVWLLPDEGRREGEPGDPDFGFGPANAAARRMPPVAFVKVGSECFYTASVLDNPAYAGVDLSGCRTTGCAFCASGGSCEVDRAPILDPALRQIEAFVSTHPGLDGPARPALRLAGYRFVVEALELARALAGRRYPAMDLLLDARVDQLVAMEQRLAEAATALDGTGHRLHVCLVGIESFSRAELQRMNKGIEPWVNLAALRVLRDLERRFPRTFRFRQHRGLSTILFTPWTSLDDLAQNLAVVRQLELENVLGKLLHSRLRLEEGLPITALARRDGLTTEAYSDRALDTARRNFYSREIPWRFLHEDVEAVNRVLTRIETDPALAGDPLYERVQRWVAGRARMEAAAEIVERARRAPGAQPDDLVSDALEIHGTLSTPKTDAAPLALAGDGDRLLALQRAGLSRVNRVECVTRDRVKDVADRLAGAGRHVSIAALNGSTGPLDVFFGSDAREVNEAVELTRALLDVTPTDAVVRARRRIGELFGYPACCSDRFAKSTSAGPALNEWLILERRCEEQGAVPAAMDPFHPSVPHVPCSLHCERTLERSRRAAAALAEIGVPPPDGLPTLFLLDRPGASVKLIPSSPVDASFDFTTAGYGGSDPRLRSVADGGRVTMDGGAILVDRGGQRVASFFLDAALFWAGGPFERGFWREVVAHALAPGRPPKAGPKEAPTPLVSTLRAALAGPLGAHVVRSVRPATAGRALLTLVRPEGPAEAIAVYVGPRSQLTPYYVACGKFVLTISKESPLRTAAQRRAVEALAALLSRLHA